MLFRDPAKTSTLQRLEDKTVFGGESVALPLASTVLLGGGALIITANPVVAAGFALLPLWMCLTNINDGMQRKIFHRRSGGCFAHLLKEQDLVALVREIGKDAVAAQLYEAIAHGQKLTPAAEELADALIEKRPATTIKQMLEELDATPTIAFADDQVIEADAVTVEPPAPIESAPAIVETQTEAKPQFGLIESVLSELRCLFLTAPPRVGKGITLTTLMQNLKRQYPQSTLLTCTIKQFAGENWYWQYSDGHINPDVTTPGLSHKAKIEAARLAYAQYKHWDSLEASEQAPAILVIDELRDHLNGFADVTMAEVSPEFAEGPIGGQSFSQWFFHNAISAATLNQCHHRFIWLVSPVMTLSGLGGIKGVTSDSLASYAGLTLVTPNALQFATAGNSTFAAPKVSADDARFVGIHGLAWSKNAKRWFAIPKVKAESIARLANNPPPLKMFRVAATVETSATVEEPEEESEFSPSDVVINYVKAKLDRAGGSEYLSRLWAQAPKSITNNMTRGDFDSAINDAVIDKIFTRNDKQLFLTARSVCDTFEAERV